MIQVHAIPAFEDNYIWLIQAEHSQKVMIVDPGTAEPVLQVLQQHELEPVAILITHHHADHVGGVNTLLQHYELPVYGPAHENIPTVTDSLTATPDLAIDAAFPPITILETPGHTPGHIAYLLDQKLFCGDTLFAGGCGRLLGGTAEQLYASLQQIRQLPPSTEVYCAHEYTEANLRFALAVEPDNVALQQRAKQVASRRQQQLITLPAVLAEEFATNPFLRCDEQAVKRAVETYIDRPLTDPLAVFTALRAWKDAF